MLIADPKLPFLRIEDASVYEALFSPDGTKIVVSLWNEAHIWDLRLGQSVRISRDEDNGNFVRRIEISPDNSMILAPNQN